MKMVVKTVLALSLLGSAVAPAASGAVMPPKLPSLREQDAIRQEWLKLRLERFLPALMRRHGVSMWLVINREYNEEAAAEQLDPNWRHCCA